MRTMTRRGLLGGAASAALGLPFLQRFAAAGGKTPSTRLFVLWTPNDAQWQDEWEVPLVHGPLPTELPSFLAPLAAFRDRLVVLSDLDCTFEGGHTSIGHALTGVEWIGPDSNNFWAGGISVDQLIASELGVEALTLGVVTGSKNGKGRLSYAGAEQPVDPVEDPAALFDALFADVGVDDAELARKRAREHSILDRVAADLVTYEQQVPTVQRPRLQQHLTAIRELEQRIDDELLASCDPIAPAALDPSDNALVPQLVRAQMSLAAQAFGCGATRVATLQVGRSGGNLTPLWPDEGIEIGVDVHTIAHDHYLLPDDASVRADAIAIEAWYSQQFAYLLAQLDAIPDPAGGSVLDHTLVVHAKELGRRHGTNPMTYVIAGGPSLVTGDRYVSCNGRPHNDLLLTLCHKLGVAVETFGDPSITTGPLEF